MHDEIDSVDSFMEWLEPRHPGETEFLQAVGGVVEHVLDTVREHQGYREQRILQRLTEPDRIITFRVVWEDDDHVPQINRGFRVQHSNALGPYKGGLRFDPSVNQSILKFLAFEQLFKNSLTGLNLGAGKGGSDFDPKCHSDAEIMRFCQAFMTELARHIGQLTDVPAGDIGVGAREIGYLFGQYKRLENRFSGALTGKSVGAGGSRLRTEATGYGAVYFLCAMLAEAGQEIEGQRIAVSGAGNVAVHAARKAQSLGAIVTTLSNRHGTLIKDDGLSAQDIETVRTQYDGDLSSIAESVSARWLDDEKPWSSGCDVAIPAATQNEIDADDAGVLIESGCEHVVEAANMPLTRAAERTLDDAGVVIAPGKAANAGGVIVSGFEITQNRLGRAWPLEKLDTELREAMQDVFSRSKEFGDSDGRIDYRRGADLAGFDRVARAVLAAGIM
ncbi:MAG: NADP-specific glutamate dehydrogenase [Woeseiaceae bacterium]